MANWFKPEHFKSIFKVGDIFTFEKGPRKGRPFKITAIGVERFLFVELGPGREPERVQTISTSMQVPWRHWNPSRYPDSLYESYLTVIPGVVKVDSKQETLSTYRVEITAEDL